MSAPVGTTQTYVASLTSTVQVVDRQGIFLLQDPHALELHTERAQLITYTVLEPDDQGNVRLFTQAQPLDPHTLRPMVAGAWQGVYLLSPTGLTAKLEEGPDPYSPLVAPDWLVWGHVQGESAYAPMVPGEQRSVRFGEVPFVQYLGPDESLDITVPTAALEFVGWESVDGIGPDAADVILNAEFRAEGTLDGAFQTAVDGSVSRTVRLVPEGFPWQAQQVFEATQVTDVIPGVVPGLVGSMRAELKTTFTYTQVAENDLTVIHQVEVGDVVNRELQPESWVLSDGSQADIFAFSGSEGEVVRITAESTEFDAYLMLLDADWQIVAEDDDSAGRSNPTLRHRLPYTGTYQIVVNTFLRDQLGKYALSLESLGREVDPLVMRAIIDKATRSLDEALEHADWDAMVAALEQTLERIRLQLPLTLEEVTLVAERPTGLGEHVPRASRLYRAGESVHVYMEPKNFHTRSEGGRHEIHLTVDATLVDVNGTVMSDLPNVMVWNRITSRPVSEVSLSVPLWLGQVPSGSYVWRITVRDVVSRQSATVEVPIVVSGSQNTAPYL